MKMSIECVLADIAFLTMTGSRVRCYHKRNIGRGTRTKGLYLLKGFHNMHYLVLKPINTCS